MNAMNPSFDELVEVLRLRLRDADAINVSELHSFRELMSDHAGVIPDQWYWEAFEELDAQGTCTALQALGTEETLSPASPPTDAFTSAL